MSHEMTDDDRINRVGWTFGAIAALAGGAVLISSPLLMPALLPAVGDAFAFDPAFLPIGGTIVGGLWVLTAMLFATVFAGGRWNAFTRGVDAALNAVWLVVMMGLVVGPRIFLSAPTDQAAKFWIAVVLVITALSSIPKIRRLARGQ